MTRTIAAGIDARDGRIHIVCKICDLDRIELTKRAALEYAHHHREWHYGKGNAA